ncbi:MAG: prolyl oligopeptidase family serine peptidase [Polyangiaceae bacterium]|nr:prolyl oligopeptidase family serine peptidase [Polyangiaceae bacterium]
MRRWSLFVLFAGLSACSDAAGDETSDGLSTGGAGGGLGGGTSSSGGSSDGGESSGGGSAQGGEAMGGAGGQSPVCPPQFSEGASHCSVSPDWAECEYNDTTIQDRKVLWQTPVGDPPPNGWPAVVIFQGTNASPDLTRAGGPDMPYGGFHQVRLQAMLLDNGFAVIAPEALGGVAWQTNFPVIWEATSDHALILALLAAFEGESTFGPIDTSRLFATGISSGGYVTSRMAVSYPGKFRALAIQSGSYATCSNAACIVPDPLPDDHPPTLFLHGSADFTVPLSTAEAYHEQLVSQGIESELIVQDGVGHAWLDVAPEEIGCWFLTH